jgi:ribonuclease VapC
LIAVDTSALLAIILGEPLGKACMRALVAEDHLVISAVTIVEALIVAERRNVTPEMMQLLDGLGFDVVAVTAASARRAVAAYRRWGKGVHPAGLNFGDCFAYEVAQSNQCGLLFVGQDFVKTDVQVVL